MSLIFLLVLSVNGCATSPQDDETNALSKANPAAYTADYFTVDKPRKKRPAADFDFYYKHCNVDEKKPFPVGDIWQCSTP